MNVGWFYCSILYVIGDSSMYAVIKLLYVLLHTMMDIYYCNWNIGAKKIISKNYSKIYDIIMHLNTQYLRLYDGDQSSSANFFLLVPTIFTRLQISSLPTSTKHFQYLA